VCKIFVDVVDTPDPSITQLLDNGVTIPRQYALNPDGTLTIPYLISTKGIAVLSPFIVDSSIIAEEPYDNVTGTFDNSINGGFLIGNAIAFDASLPVGVD
jgi:hypothetical protein